MSAEEREVRLNVGSKLFDYAFVDGLHFDARPFEHPVHSFLQALFHLGQKPFNKKCIFNGDSQNRVQWISILLG